ncbi:MAG: DUF5069 domain-containing protein [Verrucomicrobiales bacterium]
MPNLSEHPPRSPRVKLGGYVLLARILDKGRAELGRKNGEYNYNCPLDQHWFEFTGINADALKAELAAGKGDGEILAWIENQAPKKHSAWEIAQWSAYHEQRAPAGIETREFFNSLLKGAEQREDVATWFEVLDLDDFRSFGGKA